MFESNAGAGVEVVSAPGGQSSVTEAPPAEPSVIEIADENALIKVPGSDKPVKYGEHFRGFQAQATRANQERAKLERELIRERTLRENYERERQAAQQRQSQPQGQSTDVLAALRELPYLDGPQAAALAESIAQDIRQRDMVLLGTLKQLQELRTIVSQLNETHVNSSFDSKIKNWLSQGGYPPEAEDLAKEIYLAYTGDDLDQEFPKIFEERWRQIEGIVEARRRASVERARKQPFVPGRGSAPGPSKPLQFTGSESAAEIAKLLFPTIQGGDGT